MELDAKESIVLDLSKEFVMINGNNAHGVQPFEGDRFSLVFFTTAKFPDIRYEEIETLKELGFKLPTVKGMDEVKRISKAQDEFRAKALERGGARSGGGAMPSSCRGARVTVLE